MSLRPRREKTFVDRRGTPRLSGDAARRYVLLPRCAVQSPRSARIALLRARQPAEVGVALRSPLSTARPRTGRPASQPGLLYCRDRASLPTKPLTPARTAWERLGKSGTQAVRRPRACSDASASRRLRFASAQDEPRQDRPSIGTRLLRRQRHQSPSLRASAVFAVALSRFGFVWAVARRAIRRRAKAEYGNRRF